MGYEGFLHFEFELVRAFLCNGEDYEKMSDVLDNSEE